MFSTGVCFCVDSVLWGCWSDRRVYRRYIQVIQECMNTTKTDDSGNSTSKCTTNNENFTSDINNKTNRTDHIISQQNLDSSYNQVYESSIDKYTTM